MSNINPMLTFLPDTQTGRVWQRVSYSEQLPHSADVWAYRERFDNEDERIAWEKRQNIVQEALKNAKKQDQKQ